MKPQGQPAGGSLCQSRRFDETSRSVADPRGRSRVGHRPAVDQHLQGRRAGETAVNGVLDLTGKDSKLDGRHDGSKVTGTLVIGEKSWPYEAAQVQPPAGLYVYKDGDTRASWIVSSDGSVTGVQRGPNGATSAAPGLKDGTAVIDGKTVTATQVSGADQNAF